MISAMTDHVPANKGRKLPPEPLSPDEVKALIRACSKRAATGIRNRALIVMLYRAGLRISEALALLPKDLDPANSTIRVLHGKGDHDRVVGLDAGAWAILQLWLDRRAAIGINGHSPGVLYPQGPPMKSAYVRTLLPRLARKAGIDKRVHAHGLRHTHAFELAGEGTPLHVIQAQLVIRRWRPPIGTSGTEPGRRGRDDEGADLDAVEAPGDPPDFLVRHPRPRTACRLRSTHGTPGRHYADHRPPTIPRGSRVGSQQRPSSRLAGNGTGVRCG